MGQLEAYAGVVAIILLAGWPILLVITAVTCSMGVYFHHQLSRKSIWMGVVLSPAVSVICTFIAWRFWSVTTLEGPMWGNLPIPIFGPSVLAALPALMFMYLYFVLCSRAQPLAQGDVRLTQTEQ